MSDGPVRPEAAFWSGRRVAVTGATGFLGAHLTGYLVRLGANVVVLARDDVPPNPLSAEWSERVSVVHGDVTDQALLERMFSEYGAISAFHLAAQSQVGVANSSPTGTFETNVRGTWTVLEAVRRTSTVQQVIVASSDKAYGDLGSERPYDEASPLRAVNPYDVSKACADLIATTYAECFSLAVAITRCGNLFGPADLNWARLVPGTVRSVLYGERPVIRSNGLMVRDYLDVRDAVVAYLLLAEALAADPGLGGQAFNVSIERPLSVLDMVSLIQEAAGTSLEPDVQAIAINEIPYQALASTRAKERLGWNPRRTLEESLADTVAWYRGYLRDGSPS